ncbi:hypothetical protein PTSG_03031 [Salpingoeca rosetta]|uniref:PARP catalytic domain-containing protein n=1 Tax=Salpingoeca rosetta (strain ATCC 50818 / BSB-021) TaxID=946362 RepID=F2U420_SALR5|nr:uncharacterized protein PTSG_03031 [Salpingoeca rosetta]EGD82364.1 hypothetical protein PTSG_03031 [Salpingoeca rosetta]|eukprot:XP_004996547.1 hypothetical protein PTSG_03031 [Salpingoeca rosetta]
MPHHHTNQHHKHQHQQHKHKQHHGRGKEQPKHEGVDAVLLLSLYFATASGRHHDLVKPFPPMGHPAPGTAAATSTPHDRKRDADAAEQKDFDTLLSTLTNATSVRDHCAAPFISWMRHRIRLQPCPPSSLPDLVAQQLKQVKAKVACFHVQRCPSDAWLQLQHEHGTTVALHGTKMEHLYSILNHGFCGALNKTALFGPGTYCATDMSVCQMFSPTSKVPPGLAPHVGSRLSHKHEQATLKVKVLRLLRQHGFAIAVAAYAVFLALSAWFAR